MTEAGGGLYRFELSKSHQPDPYGLAINLLEGQPKTACQEFLSAPHISRKRPPNTGVT